MPTCPNGHQSGADDWCEVCGHRMAGTGAAAGAMPGPTPPPAHGYGFPPAGGDATQAAELCPQCRTPREAMAPFCEECRYNFLTRSATAYNPAAPPGGGRAPMPGAGYPQQPQPPQDGYDYQGSRPSQLNRPAEPLAQEQPYQQQPGPVGYPQQGRHPGQPQAPQHHDAGAGTFGDDWMLPPPGGTQAPQQQGHPGQQHQGYQQHQQPQHQHQHQQPGQYQGGGQAAGGGPGSWYLTIAPDRDYFMAMMQRSGPEAAGLNLPAYSPEKQLPLSGSQITIGRRRNSTGASPDIDLSVPPEDPGVSHQHAVLVQQPDGSWAVVDQNSTNGTTINGGEESLQPYTPIPLREGDRVHVGAWTTITIRRG
ncbi:FHA domain-containing protein [Streptomyces sp. NPDC006879]|uniref:FHA domain-containing protein n=1 Tax=Streptomyces sp. NPDC006879 TaxID=3364767 RepID=UPI003684DF5D